MTRGALALGLLALCLCAPSAFGDAHGDYGDVPGALAAIHVSQNDRALGTRALRLLEEAEHTTTPSWDHVRTQRAQLILLGPAGLRLVAERLCAGKTTPWLRLHLVSVAAESEHAGADLLLAIAAKEPTTALRLVAAEGLGRGRTPRAVTLLEALTHDEAPGVQICALRSLFAIDSPQAREARIAAPQPIEPRLLARRLAWHRRVRDADARVAKRAVRAWALGTTAEVRTEAAAYLADARCGATTSLALLEDIIQAFGRVPRFPGPADPKTKYDPIAQRRIAIDAALTLLDREGLPPAKRTGLIEQALHWVGNPVVFEDSSREDEVPEFRLLRRLPDLGRELFAPTVAALEAGSFARPRNAFLLLGELGPDVTLPWVQDYLRRQLDAGIPNRHEFGLACSALVDLRRIGDEDLARRLFLELPKSLGSVRRSIRTDVGAALRTDPGDWVVPLVAQALYSKDNDLEAEAQRVLRVRPEHEAWQARVEAFFRRPGHRGHDRISSLVWRGDERAYAILKRALSDARRIVRYLAVKQFNPRHRALHDAERFVPLLKTVESKLRAGYEVRDYVYALIMLDPDEAVAYVRRAWDTLPDDDAREFSLRILQEVRTKSARRAAIDLALEKAGSDAPLAIVTAATDVLQGHWTHRTKDVEAFWRRLLQPGHPRRELAVRRVATPGAVDLTDLLLPMVTEVWKTDTPPNEDEDQARVEQIEYLVRALGYQPREKTEALLVEAALDPLMPEGARHAAIDHLMGNLSDDARQRLMIWSGTVLPTEGTTDPFTGLGADDTGDMQWRVAQVIGAGAKGDVAEALLRTLDKEIAAWAKKQPEFRKTGRKPSRDFNIGNRIRASTRAIAETRHTASVAALIDRLFDPRLIRVVQMRAESFASSMEWAGPGAAGRRPSHPSVLEYSDNAPAEVALDPASSIVGQLKVLEDDKLAPLLEAALKRAHERGGLARVPDVYFAILCGQFLDRRTRACVKTARVLLQHALRTPPRDSAAEARALSWMTEALAERGMYEEILAHEEQRLRIVARRVLERPDVELLRAHRLQRDVIHATVLARAGKTAQARAAFSKAMLHAPHNRWSLNSVAWSLFESNLDLGLAEDLARRAVRLDRRTPGAASRDIADTLACILLARGKTIEAIELFRPHMRTLAGSRTGVYDLHWAWLLVAAGDLGGAEAALVKALRIDPGLEERLADDKWLKPLRPRFQAAVRQADSERALEP